MEFACVGALDVALQVFALGFLFSSVVEIKVQILIFFF